MGLDPLTLGVMAGVGVLGGVGAIGSINQGKAEAESLRRQGDYNAQVYEQQAEMINQQKKLQEYKDNRAAARLRGAVMAKTGKSGFEMGGSPLAVMIDNETQMELDKQIGQYNYGVQQSYLRTQAGFTRYQYGENARLAKASGYSNAFTTIMGTIGSMATIGFGAAALGGGATTGSGKAFNALGDTMSGGFI